jgi:CelD/BcsL family acetyltransferase involved in cellulose biosynthesis
MDAFPDRVVFQTREWLDFVARTQGAEPVIAAVRAGSETVGFFTGLVVRRFGVRILGSPFPGWTTSSMGFNLQEGVDRRAAAAAVVRFAFGPLRCLHLELKDRHLGVDDVRGLGFRSDPVVTFEVDLAADEDVILGRMSSACRRAIRKSEKVGVEVEVASPAGFAEEYYAQLVDVFAKQGLVPTYGEDRVARLIEHVHPTGRLLLVRARGPDGGSLATGLFPAFNGTAYFWGGASWRSGQIHRPNEALFWYAMRHWRERGVRVLDMGGGGDYKRKYAPTEHSVPFLRTSRVRGLERLRDAAQWARGRSQQRAGQRVQAGESHS